MRNGPLDAIFTIGPAIPGLEDGQISGKFRETVPSGQWTTLPIFLNTKRARVLYPSRRGSKAEETLHRLISQPVSKPMSLTDIGVLFVDDGEIYNTAVICQNDLTDGDFNKLSETLLQPCGDADETYSLYPVSEDNPDVIAFGAVQARRLSLLFPHHGREDLLSLNDGIRDTKEYLSLKTGRHLAQVRNDVRRKGNSKKVPVGIDISKSLLVLFRNQYPTLLTKVGSWRLLKTIDILPIVCPYTRLATSLVDKPTSFANGYTSLSIEQILDDLLSLANPDDDATVRLDARDITRNFPREKSYLSKSRTKAKHILTTKNGKGYSAFRNPDILRHGLMALDLDILMMGFRWVPISGNRQTPAQARRAHSYTKNYSSLSFTYSITTSSGTARLSQMYRTVTMRNEKIDRIKTWIATRLAQTREPVRDHFEILEKEIEKLG